MSDARTTIITVTYNSAAVLPSMLASCVQGVPCIVVDNASTDESADIARAAGAQTICLAANEGFGRACNAGAAIAKTEFLFFVNPDAVIEPDCLRLLEAAADAYPQASAFNPAISDTSGGEYFKRRSVLLASEEWMVAGWPKGDCEVPVLSGAALFCRRTAFESVGGFDPDIFLYHEDDDLALRLRARSGPLMFIRAARVLHQEGRSSPRSAQTATIKSYHMAQSRVYALRKHGRPYPFARSFLTAIGKLASPVILISARKRAQAIAFMRGVLSARH